MELNNGMLFGVLGIDAKYWCQAYLIAFVFKIKKNNHILLKMLILNSENNYVSYELNLKKCTTFVLIE